ESLSERSIEEDRLRSDVGMTWKVCAELGLNESVRLEQLIEGREGLERGRARAESAGAISDRQQHTSLQGQDGPRFQVGEHDPLHAESHVADAAVPDVILVLEVNRHVDFNLIVHAEALLVDD